MKYNKKADEVLERMKATKERLKAAKERAASETPQERAAREEALKDPANRDALNAAGRRVDEALARVKKIREDYEEKRNKKR